MEVLGITIRPPCVPQRINLRLLAAAAWFTVFAFGGIAGLLLAIYLLLFTSLWLLTAVYLFWAWIVDRKTSECGGRSNDRVRSWIWWKYFKEYFPVRLECETQEKLDPDLNYLFCCFPHGIIPVGPFASFVYNGGGFKDLFPSHKAYVITLAINFYMPFFRELVLALGACSSSAKSIRYILGSKGGGKAVFLSVGGAAESYYCRPKQYKLILKNRKGFVRLAMESGAPLVPVISFGETEIFDQIGDSKSGIRAIQEFFRKFITIAPIIPLGRGLFQNSFGIIPRQKPITCLGKK